ncbi:MAG TPA: recombinase family protein, partial [Kiloniellaceae bacterium]|nr:recombinase family protein [Kiloniellaceae bacterium]
ATLKVGYNRVHGYYIEIGILTLAEGAINELHIGLKGTMNALFLKDLAEKTRRGIRGRVEAGRSGGGRAYGYKVVHAVAGGTLERGRREIDETETAVVRRIFADYIAGRSARAIAQRLNAEGIPAPSGGKWNASTIAGNRRRRTGILNNELYRGRQIWNRQRFVKDPTTGKRQARPNPESHWHVVDLPELRIVSDDLWRQKEELLEAIAPAGQAPRGRAQRPKRLLSGLLRCDRCGGPMAIAGPARYGCTNFRESGTCSNNRSISARKVERRVLDGLREKLLAPEAIAAAVKAYHAELRRRSQVEAECRQAGRRELARIEKEIAGMIAAIKGGLYAPEMNAQMETLRARKAELEAAAAEPSAVIDFHPQVAELYKARIAELQEALERDEETRLKAIAAIRDLIDRIVVVFGDGRGEFEVEIEGRLARILALAHGESQDQKSMGLLVAGAGFEPATFRL